MRVSKSEEERRIILLKDKAREIYKKNGVESLVRYLNEIEKIRKIERKKIIDSVTVVDDESFCSTIHCPKCGSRFNHNIVTEGKVTGVIGGASAGAILGSQIGIALGPFRRNCRNNSWRNFRWHIW